MSRLMPDQLPMRLPTVDDLRREEWEERSALIEEGNPGMSRSEAEAIAWRLVYGEVKK